MASRTSDIYENGERVVRHVFYGKTPAEARAVERAHASSDRFFGAATRHRRFQGMRLTLRRRGRGGRRA